MPTKSSDQGTGGFSFFQLFIFLIATSSMAVNFAIIYGVIPLKGNNLGEEMVTEFRFLLEISSMVFLSTCAVLCNYFATLLAFGMRCTQIAV